jgi:hypothetical protein
LSVEFVGRGDERLARQCRVVGGDVGTEIVRPVQTRTHGGAARGKPIQLTLRRVDPRAAPCAVEVRAVGICGARRRILCSLI